MSKTYAIADLHGRYDLLGQALEAIKSHSQERPLTLVLMGDYVDRGPQSANIIFHLRSLQDYVCDSAWHVVCLKGNHEDMMVQCLTGRANMDWWIGNGGNATLASYGGGDLSGASAVLEEDIKWLANLPKVYQDKHRVFVHAGLDDGVEIDDHLDDVLLWKLYLSTDEGGYFGKHVVHGHHQFENGPVLKRDRTDLDTFAWATGRLVIGVFDDDIPGGPVELIEVQGDRAVARSGEILND